jgi:hypothetical protein
MLGIRVFLFLKSGGVLRGSNANILTGERRDWSNIGMGRRVSRSLIS